RRSGGGSGYRRRRWGERDRRDHQGKRGQYGTRNQNTESRVAHLFSSSASPKPGHLPITTKVTKRLEGHEFPKRFSWPSRLSCSTRLPFFLNRADGTRSARLDSSGH